eukprot:339387-Hanusia_phi.AAC.2
MHSTGDMQTKDPENDRISLSHHPITKTSQNEIMRISIVPLEKLNSRQRKFIAAMIQKNTNEAFYDVTLKRASTINVFVATIPMNRRDAIDIIDKKLNKQKRKTSILKAIKNSVEKLSDKKYDLPIGYIQFHAIRRYIEKLAVYRELVVEIESLHTAQDLFDATPFSHNAVKVSLVASMYKKVIEEISSEKSKKYSDTRRQQLLSKEMCMNLPNYNFGAFIFAPCNDALNLEFFTRHSQLPFVLLEKQKFLDGKMLGLQTLLSSDVLQLLKKDILSSPSTQMCFLHISKDTFVDHNTKNLTK